MSILLNRETVRRDELIGDDDFELASGQSLKIESSPGGEEIINVEVPVGKKWQVHIAVIINELDV